MLGNLFEEKKNGNGGSSSSSSTQSKPPDKRAKSGFVGLRNQGATCYLNSLLQVMYMTPELRHGLYSLDPIELGADLIEEFDKQKKADEKKGIVDADESMLLMLLEMGLDAVGAKKSLVATKNSVDAALDYYHAHLNDTNFTVDLESAANEESKRKKKKPRLIPLEMQRLFTQLDLLDLKDISTEDLTSKGFQWTNIEGRMQHDAHELNRLLIDALERSLKGTSGADLPQQLYQGVLGNRIKCLNCENISIRQENYYDLNVQVQDCPDLAASLCQYTANERMEGAEAYACDVCRSKQTALRSTVLTTLPPILTLSCNRFRCDQKTKWERQKIIARSSFPLIINMSPFKAGNAMNRQEKGNGLDENDIQYTRNQMVWIGDIWAKALDLAKQLISTHGDEVTLEQLTSEELAKLAKEALTLETFFETGQRENLYELHAVIMHRGSAYSGHYFAYIRDALNQGKWEMTNQEFESRFALAGGSKKGGTPQAFKAEDGVTVVVNDASTLATIVNILVANGTVNTSTKSSAVNKSMNRDILARFYKNQMKVAWTTLHKDTLGSLVDFLRCYPDLFELDSSHVVLKDVPLEFTSEEKFSVLLETAMSKAKTASPTTTTTAAEAVATSSIDAVDGKDSLVVDTSMDESLALALSEEGAADAMDVSDFNVNNNNNNNNNENSGANETSDAWQTKEKKKRRGGKGGKETTTSQQQQSSSSNNNNDDDANSSAATLLDQRKAAKQKLAAFRVASEICNRFHGHFYEFNDSDVTAMPLIHLEKAFEGKDSAYLLVYRRVQQPTTSSSSSSTIVVENIPTTSNSKDNNNNNNRQDDDLMSVDNSSVSTPTVTTTTVNPTNTKKSKNKNKGANVINTSSSSPPVAEAEISTPSSGNPADKKKQRSGDSSVVAADGGDAVVVAGSAHGSNSSESTSLVDVMEMEEQASNSSSQEAIRFVTTATTIGKTNNNNNGNGSVLGQKRNFTVLSKQEPPAFWKQRVTALNNSIQLQRSDFETSRSVITFRVYSPVHVHYTEPLLFMKESSLLLLSKTTLPESMHKCLEVTVSLQSTINDMLAHLSKEYSSLLSALGLVEEPTATAAPVLANKSTRSRRSTSSATAPTTATTTTTPTPVPPTLCLSVLLPRDDGFFAREIVKGDKTLAEASKDGLQLLWWDGKTIDKKEIISGKENTPLKMTFTCLTVVDEATVLLMPGSTSSKTKPTTTTTTSETTTAAEKLLVDRIERSSTVSLYFPQSWTMEKVCAIVQEQVLNNNKSSGKGKNSNNNKVHLPRITNPCIHLINRKGGNNKTNWSAPPVMSSRTRSSNDNNKSVEKGLEAYLLWVDGKVMERYNNGKAASAAAKALIANSTVAQVVGSDSHAFVGCDLLVEEATAVVATAASVVVDGGVGAVSRLAELEVHRRNNTWELTIEVEFDFQALETYLLEHPVETTTTTGATTTATTDAAMVAPVIPELNFFAVEEGTTTTATAAKTVDLTKETTTTTIPTSVKVEIDRTSTIGTLKAKALKALNINNNNNIDKYLPITLLRNVFVREEDTVADESKRLVDIGLFDHATLSLGLGTKPKSDNITVRFTVVTGNDKSNVKHNHQQPGVRGRDVGEEEFSPLTPIKTIREALGIRLLGLPAGWTETVAPTTTTTATTTAAVSSTGEALTADEQAALQLQQQEQQQQVPRYRLRRTNWLEEPGELVQEEDNNGLLLTLSSESITDKTLLLLEEGDLPVKGLITFNLFLWQQQPYIDTTTTATEPMEVTEPSSSTTTATATVAALEGKEKVDGMEEDVVVLEGGAVTAPTVIETIAAQRNQHLLSVGSVKCHEDKPLLLLHEQVYQQLLQERERLQEVKPLHPLCQLSLDDEKLLLLRELRSDLLPGRCYWSCDVSKMDTQDVTAIGKVTVSSNNNSINTVCTQNTLLKKLQFRGNEISLVIEMLSEPQETKRPKQGSFRIWAQQLLNPSLNEEGGSKMSPSWPPVEVLVEGGVAPTLGHVRRPVCSALKLGLNSNTNNGNVVMFKYMPQNYSWFELLPGMKAIAGGVVKNMNRGGNSNNKKVENVLQAPYSFKEGDLVCAFETPSLLAAATAAATAATTTTTALLAKKATIVSRPEDLHLREQMKLKKTEKRNGGRNRANNNNNNSNGGGGSRGDGRKRKPVVEVALTLGGDLDFDDSDEDDDDEDNNNNNNGGV